MAPGPKANDEPKIRHVHLTPEGDLIDSETGEAITTHGLSREDLLRLLDPNREIGPTRLLRDVLDDLRRGISASADPALTPASPG
jgi:hypothetical protein